MGHHTTHPRKCSSSGSSHHRRSHNRYWKTAIHAATLIVNIVAAAFNEFVLIELMDPDKGLNGVAIPQIFDRVMLQFANVLQLEVNTNLIKFNEPMDPSVTLVVYVRRQEQC
jgi:hypothetical protein